MMHEKWMQLAYEQACLAGKEDEIPIGAVLIKNNQLIASAYNARERSKNPLDHAEMVVLKEAAEILGDWRLSGTTLYVTLEPCLMCLGALIQARVDALVYAASDPKRKNTLIPSLESLDVLSANNHHLNIVSGVMENECSQILREFFKVKRRSSSP